MILPDKKFWEVFKATPGALSCAEAIAITNVCFDAPRGTYLELGSHKGKSYLAAALGLSDGVFHLIDPIFEDDEICAGLARLFYAHPSTHIEKKLHAAYSLDILPQFDNLAYCMVDSGSHGDGLPMSEAKMLKDKMVKGGIIGWHDWNSQFHEVKEAADWLVSTGEYEYVHIDWPRIEAYCNEHNLEEGNDSWHHNELKNPMFFAAIRRK